MNVSVRDISARCNGCGGRDFQQVRKGPLRLATRLTCRTCGRSTTYRALLEVIGKAAMRRANAALRKLARSVKAPSHRK